jgi:hypothetical protein
VQISCFLELAPGFSDLHQLYRSTQFPCANDLASRLLVIHLLHLSTEAMMLECFLLLRHAAGGRWIPFFAIPLVIAGGAASISLMLSGVKGLLAARHQPDRRARGHDRPHLVGL